MISSGGHTRHHNDRSWAMHGINNQINKGETKNFQFTNTIPNDITSYTAIGRVTARYFVLHLYTVYGCCANTAYAQLHLIVHSRNPRLMTNPQLNPPQMWHPNTFPQIVNQNMKPFVLSPLPQIPVANMPGQTVIANMNANMNTGGYDQPNQGIWATNAVGALLQQ